jgi:hypothetical protein
MPETNLDRAFDIFVLEVERVATAPGAAQARTTVRVRRAGVAAVALLLVALLGGISVAATGGGHEPRPAAPVTTEHTRVTDQQFYPTSAIDGHWQTRHLSQAELRRLLLAAGRDGVLAWWESHAPAGRPRLTLAAGRVQGRVLAVGTDSRPYLKRLDWGFFTSDGDEVRLLPGPGAPPNATLRCTVTGDRLACDVVASDWSRRYGVSGVEQARVLYSSLPFTRFVGSGVWGG